MNTFYIENLGCSKNQVDAEQMIAHLSVGSWKYLSTPEGADVIVINTCGFVESAREESIQVALGFREEYPEAKIVMSGCMAQRYSNELMESMPEVDAFFGNKDLVQIERVLNRVVQNERFALVPGDTRGVKGDSTNNTGQNNAGADIAIKRSTFFSFPKSAYVKLSEGCNHRCTYCAIPLIRGSLQSRSLESVLTEIKGLLADGVFEINLIAQDLASFGQDMGTPNFVRLLEEISKLEGNFWIRLLYIHPDNFPWDIIPIMQRDSRILPYFDIPIQHVSSTILPQMGRRGDGNSYGALVERLRKEFPHGAIRTTFLLGFPGESKETLEELASYVEKIGFDWAGFFIYSPEEGTKSIELSSKQEAQASIDVANAFLPRLQELQSGITTERMSQRVGRTVSALVEEPIEGEDLSFGRVPFQAPEVDGCTVLLKGDLEPGSVVEVKLTGSSGPDMSGEVL